MSQPTSWSSVIGRFRLGWRLLRDPAVPGWTKLIPLGTLAYILLPVDIVPDIFLGLGQLDDLGVVLLGLRAFIAMCPRTAVLRHTAAMSSVDGVARDAGGMALPVITDADSLDAVDAHTIQGALAPPPDLGVNDSTGWEEV